MLGAGIGRIRSGQRRERTHSRQDEHFTLAHRNSLQRIQFHGGICGRVGIGFARNNNFDSAQSD